MKIKTHFLIVISFLIVTTKLSFSQINVGPFEDGVIKSKKFPEGNIEELKKTKTVFIYGKNDETELENWKKIFEKVWTLTPVEFVSYENIDAYSSNPNYSFITISARKTTETTSQSNMPDVSFNYMQFYLRLSMRGVDAKGKTFNRTFFRIELNPNYYTMHLLELTKKENFFNTAYEKGKFYSFYPGLIMNELKIANDHLKTGETRWMFSSQSNKDEMTKLKSDTLFIPDYVLINFDKLSGDELRKFDEVQLMALYSGKYKFITAKELSDKILNDTHGFYYMLYIKSSSNKFINVFNSNNGELIYSEYKARSYNVKEDDFKDMMDVVK